MATLVLVGASMPAAAMADPPQVREVFAEEFLNARPAAKVETPSKPVNRRPTVYHATPPAVNGANASIPQLGMTLWRLRPARTGDSTVRILVHEPDGTAEWIPERVNVGTALRNGDRVRLGFESTREGYLYVIDAEQYPEGKSGDPYLVFPTTRTRNGDNRVTPGRLIEIPAQDDRPNFLTLQHSRPDQLGEMLSVIVTPSPLSQLTIGPSPLQLERAQVAEWQKQWEHQVQTLEVASSNGRAWTKAEQEAGANGTRLLTQDEPGPQTIYRISTSAGQPLLVTIRLQYSRNHSPK